METGLKKSVLQFPRFNTLKKVNIGPNDVLFIGLKDNATESVAKGWQQTLIELDIKRVVIYKGDVEIKCATLDEVEKRKKNESSKEFERSLK